MISSKAAIGIAAGVCGTLILGYCIYFDKQRHDDPDFKKKLRERKLETFLLLCMEMFSKLRILTLYIHSN